MPVHSISSDLHRGNIDVCVLSLARTMSKFRLLGMSLEDVVRATTIGPARAVGLDKLGLGSLAVGGPATISLFKETNRAVEVEDAEGDKRTTESWIEPVGCFIDGTYHAAKEVV